MLTWFTEDSLVPLLLGSLLGFSFLALAITHYSRAMFGLALIVGLLTATIGGIEFWVITEREEIQAIVRRLATAVERHNVEEIENAISDKRVGVRVQARQEMQNYRIDSCRLIDFTDFKVDDSAADTKPMKAEITFVILARGSNINGLSGTAHERVTLFFEREQPIKNQTGSWKIIDFKHQYARAGGRL